MSWSEARRPRRGHWHAAALMAFTASVLAGCGFHLQGSANLPEGARNVFIATQDELTPFAVALRQSLERGGAQFAPSAAAADMVVRIRVDRTGRRVLAVSSTNTPEEYEISYVIEYTIDRAGKEVVAPQRLELTRSFSYQASEILAKDREEQGLREAMARDLSNLVLRKIESL